MDFDLNDLIAQSKYNCKMVTLNDKEKRAYFFRHDQDTKVTLSSEELAVDASDSFTEVSCHDSDYLFVDTSKASLNHSLQSDRVAFMRYAQAQDVSLYSKFNNVYSAEYQCAVNVVRYADENQLLTKFSHPLFSSLHKVRNDFIVAAKQVIDTWKLANKENTEHYVKAC